MNIALIITIIIPLIIFLYKNYFGGLGLALLLLVTLTVHLGFEIPGDFPDITIHRLIVTILIIFWFLKFKKINIKKIKYLSLLYLFCINYLISLLISGNISMGISPYLSFIIETLLYYIVISSSLNKTNQISILIYLLFGLTIVAFLAFLEKYTGFNPVDSLVSGYVRNYHYRNDVLSTYPHRILLGTAMAMGWPIALSLLEYFKKDRLKLILIFISLLLLSAACYFSNSRGPWISLIISGTIMFILGSSYTRKILLFIILIVAITLVTFPGVWETLERRTSDTMDDETLKGSSYQYRWELWQIAFYEISKSPETMLWGYGLGSSSLFNMERTISYSGHTRYVWSWDNQYALFLLETGLIGFFLSILLYLSIIKNLYKKYVYLNNKNDKIIIAGILSSVIVLVFMMSNVAMFAFQLHFLFWSLVAIGNNFPFNKMVKNVDLD